MRVDMDPMPPFVTAMKPIAYWMPAAFCAFLSVLALFGATSSGDAGWWEPTFYAFLPMCFFFAGSAMAMMGKEIKALKEQVAALEKAQG